MNIQIHFILLYNLKEEVRSFHHRLYVCIVTQKNIQLDSITEVITTHNSYTSIFILYGFTLILFIINFTTFLFRPL